MKKYLTLFLSEAQENLQTLNQELMVLEKEPENKDSATTLMRAAHTLKSSSAAMGFTQISALVHNIEDIFDGIRSGKETFLRSYSDTLFVAFDVITTSLQAIKLGKPEMDTADTIATLRNLKGGDGKASTLPKVQQLQMHDEVPVNIKILDKLATLSEELLVNRMRFSEISGSEKFEELPMAVDAMSRLITELQYNITQARMVPLNEIFIRFPRLIRDMSSTEGKEIAFEMEGGDIELDRSIIGKIGEPLVHLLRNAVDHGIDEKGHIKLSATKEKAFVNISVTNTGKSIDVEQVRKTALLNNLVTEDESQELTVPDVLHILAHPEFTTSTSTTESSGRGIGVHIVKTAVEGAGGKLTLESPLADNKEGTKFSLHLPITIAIVQALLVRVGKDLYAIPLSNVEKSVRLEQHQMKTALNKRMAMLDGMNIPLFSLRDLMGVPEEVSENALENQKSKSIAVIARKSGYNANSKENEGFYALLVDDIVLNQEVVVKSLRGMVKDAKGFAGITILGNGKPALILDIDTLLL
jgi:two-component system, chemotaxis family, sensor kinase CheA